MKEVTGEASVLIKAPAHQLYDYLLHLERHSEWVKNLYKVEQVSPGEIGVGTIFHAQEGAPPVATWPKVRMMYYVVMGLISGAKPYSEAEITALEPDKRIAWQAGMRKGSGWFNRANWELILEPQSGGTRLTQRFRYMPQDATAEKMVCAAGPKGIAAACAVSLQRLKDLMEAQPAGTLVTNKVAKGV